MILIISTCEHSLHEYEFVDPLVKIFPEARVVHYKELHDEYKTVDAAIISGTSLQDEEYLKHMTKFDWIKTYEKPIIGICAGAQIIAKLNWATLSRNKEIGPIIVQGKTPFPKSFEAYALHNNTISERSDFEILAKNQFVQAFRIKNHYGILFHPEVRNEEILKDILKIHDISFDK